MLTVCCFLWHDPQAKHRELYRYTPAHVHVLRNQVARHLGVPHEFVCVTDEPGVIDRGIRTVEIDLAAHVPGTRFVKLMLFRRDAAALIGERILYLDLDMVVTGSLDPLVDRGEDLVLWRNPNFGVPRRARYNTSILLLRGGARPEIWERFDKRTSPEVLRKLGWGGTDQAWVSHMVSPDEAHWTDADGVYGAGRLGDVAEGVGSKLPDDARIVAFPGKREPSMPSMVKLHPWIVDHRW